MSILGEAKGRPELPPTSRRRRPSLSGQRRSASARRRLTAQPTCAPLLTRVIAAPVIAAQQAQMLPFWGCSDDGAIRIDPGGPALAPSHSTRRRRRRRPHPTLQQNRPARRHPTRSPTPAALHLQPRKTAPSRTPGRPTPSPHRRPNPHPHPLEPNPHKLHQIAPPGAIFSCLCWLRSRNRPFAYSASLEACGIRLLAEVLE